MKETKDVLRIVGMVLLVLFVLAVGVPLVLAAAGMALGIVGFLISLAVMLIIVAIAVAIIYLIVVGIRALLKCTESLSPPSRSGYCPASYRASFVNKSHPLNL